MRMVYKHKKWMAGVATASDEVSQKRLIMRLREWHAEEEGGGKCETRFQAEQGTPNGSAALFRPRLRRYPSAGGEEREGTYEHRGESESRVGRETTVGQK